MAITRNAKAKKKLISDQRTFKVSFRNNFMLPPLRSKKLKCIVSNEERLQWAGQMERSKTSNRCGGVTNSSGSHKVSGNLFCEARKNSPARESNRVQNSRPGGNLQPQVLDCKYFFNRNHHKLLVPEPFMNNRRSRQDEISCKVPRRHATLPESFDLAITETRRLADSS